MVSSKKWYQSTTIWGIVTGALGFLLYSIGVANQPIPANADFEQLKAYAEAIKNANGNVTERLEIGKNFKDKSGLLYLTSNYSGGTLYFPNQNLEIFIKYLNFNDFCIY